MIKGEENNHNKDQREKQREDKTKEKEMTKLEKERGVQGFTFFTRKLTKDKTKDLRRGQEWVVRVYTSI